VVTESHETILVYYERYVRGIENFDEVEKLGQGFSWADPLEEIDIEDGIIPRLTIVNKHMSLEHMDAIIKLLRDYVDCFA
jgi:hypothetical protein